MSEWKEYKLGEIVMKVTSGGTPSTKNAKYYNGNIPWLNTKEINFNRIWRTEKYISEKGFKNSSAKWIKENSVIVAMYGATAAKVAINKIPLTTNQACCNLIIDETKANYEFVFYSIWNKYDELENIAVGAAQQNLSVGVIADFPIQLPLLPEQKAIASVLSSLDDKIDLLHRQNATLEKMAETLFRKCFIEDAKEEWKSGRVGDLIRILSGFAFKSSSFVESGKYRLITIKGVQDGYLELTNSNRIDELPEQMPEFCKLQIGDILLSLTGNVGRCCLVDTTYLLLNQRVAKLHPIKERDKAFTYFFFRQPKIKQLLEDMAKGTAQANLSPIETSNMELKIPDDYTLNEFSSLVTPWLEKLIFNKKSIQTLTKIRDSLLPKLMSGEVTVEMP